MHYVTHIKHVWLRQTEDMHCKKKKSITSLRRNFSCDETGLFMPGSALHPAFQRTVGVLEWSLSDKLSFFFAMPFRWQPSWVEHPAGTLNIWHSLWIHSTQVRANYGPHLVTQPRVTGFENASEHFEMPCFGLERTGWVDAQLPCFCVVAGVVLNR